MRDSKAFSNFNLESNSNYNNSMMTSEYGFLSTKSKFNKNSSMGKFNKKPGKLGLMPSTTTLEAELIQVKQKLNESKLIIKRISVDNLKLEEENKKISNLMEKVIQSYNPESHSHFIENGNKNNNNENYLNVEHIETNTNTVKSNNKNTSYNVENTEEINTEGDSKNKGKTHKSKVIGNMDINKTAEKHIKELKDNYIFKKLKETIKDLKFQLEEKENEIVELKNNSRAISYTKLEKDFKLKIDECVFLKEENMMIIDSLKKYEFELSELKEEINKLKENNKRSNQKLEEKTVSHKMLESDYFRQGQELKESKDKVVSLKYQITSIRNDMSHKKKELETLDELQKKTTNLERENNNLEKKLKEVQIEKKFIKSDLEKKNNLLSSLENKLASDIEKKIEIKEKGRNNNNNNNTNILKTNTKIDPINSRTVQEENTKNNNLDMK